MTPRLRDFPRPLAIFSAALLAASFFVACQGDGSDVGPQFDPLPAPQLLGRVVDRAYRPVHGARVSLGPIVAQTDETGRFHLDGPPIGTRTLVLDGEIASGVDGASRFASYTRPVTFETGRVTLDRLLVVDELARGGRQLLPVGVPLPPGTAVTDPATGARLLLTGTVLSFEDPAARAGVSEVEVRLSVLDPEDVPLAVDLDPAAEDVWQSGLVAVLEPLDLRLTPSQLVLPNTLGHPPGTALRGARLASGDLEWVDLGGTSVMAGSVDLGPTVDRAGLYTHAKELVIADLEWSTVRGRVLSRSGRALGGFLVTGGSASSFTEPDGTYELTNVPALDGNQNPLTITLRGEAPVDFRAESVTTSLDLVPGGVTEAPPLRFTAVPTSDVQVLVVQRGNAAVAKRTTVGNVASGVHRGFSDEDGQVIFRDVVRALRNGASAQVRDDERERFAFSDRVPFEFQGQARRRIKLFLGEVLLRARRFRGSTSVRVVVEGSSAPIENAFVMSGLDGTRSGRRDVTTFTGQAQIDTIQPRPAILTAGIRTEAPSTDGVHEFVRRIAYRTYWGLERRSPVIELSVTIDPARPEPIPPYGAIEGRILGTTDPNVVPPTRQRYETRVLAHREAIRDEVLANALGLQEFLPLVRTNLPRLNERVDFLDPSFLVACDLGRVEGVAVERDVDALGFGTIVQAGLAPDPLRVAIDPNTRAEWSLTVPARAPTTVAVAGLDARLANGVPRTSFGWHGREGRAVFCGSIDDAAWSAGGTQLEAVWTDPPASVRDGRTWLATSVLGASTGAVLEQRAAVLDPLAETLTFAPIPEILVPAPGQPFLPLDAGPTGGLVFQRDPNSVSFTRITLSRSESVPEKQSKVLVQYEWVVEVSNTPPEGFPPDQVVFPLLPDRVREIEIPPFFLPGVYDVLVENVRADDFDFGLRAAFRDTLSLSEQEPRAVSRYRTTVIVP